MKKIVFEPVGDVINFNDVDQGKAVFVKDKGLLIGMCIWWQKEPSTKVWTITMGKVGMDDYFFGEFETLEQLIENSRFEFFVED